MPPALAIGAAVRERLGTDLYAICTDDGIALRLPDGRRRDVIGGLALLAVIAIAGLFIDEWC